MDQLLGLLDETQASLKQFTVAQAPGHHVQATVLPWKVTKLQENVRDMRVLDDVDAVEHTVALVENDVTNLVFEEEFVRPDAGCTARRARP